MEDGKTEGGEWRIDDRDRGSKDGEWKIEDRKARDKRWKIEMEDRRWKDRYFEADLQKSSALWTILFSIAPIRCHAWSNSRYVSTLI